MCKLTGVAYTGSWDLSGVAVTLQRVTKLIISGMVWKGQPQRVTVPYTKVMSLAKDTRVPQDT